jgi:hypothetical protein
MFQLTLKDIDEVSGGIPPVVIAVAVVSLLFSSKAE